MDDPPPTGPDCDCPPDVTGTRPAATIPLSRRDCAILRAVAAGRCMVCSGLGGPLTVDGVFVSDQFTVTRLERAGLITAAGPAPTAALLTAEGQARLRAA